jgi:hypothetical protein
LDFLFGKYTIWQPWNTQRCATSRDTISLLCLNTHLSSIRTCPICTRCRATRHNYISLVIYCYCPFRLDSRKTDNLGPHLKALMQYVQK